MPFTIRPYRRFPIYCPVTYHAGVSAGQGMVWNLSVNGWRLSSIVLLRVRQTFTLTMHSPNPPSLFMADAIVRWVRGQEYGLEARFGMPITRVHTEGL